VSRTPRLTDKIWDAFGLIFLFTTCIGSALAWRWPLFGGAITTAAILLYYVARSVDSGKFWNNLYFNLMLLAGILFMASDLIRRRKPGVRT
jgi:hypothetical protein